jgi:hypothetical protein
VAFTAVLFEFCRTIEATQVLLNQDLAGIRITHETFLSYGASLSNQ